MSNPNRITPDLQRIGREVLREKEAHDAGYKAGYANGLTFAASVMLGVILVSLVILWGVLRATGVIR